MRRGEFDAKCHSNTLVAHYARLTHPPQHWPAAWPASCVRATPSARRWAPSAKFGVRNAGPARSAGDKFKKVCPVRRPRPAGPDKEFSRQVLSPVFLLSYFLLMRPVRTVSKPTGLVCILAVLTLLRSKLHKQVVVTKPGGLLDVELKVCAWTSGLRGSCFDNYSREIAAWHCSNMASTERLGDKLTRQCPPSWSVTIPP